MHVATETREQITLVDRFREDIVNGVYIPRERLVEADLAEHYGVKRSAIRAAIMQLSAEGLVEREPMRGARVRALTPAEGIEIAQVRRELESLCARLASERGTEEEHELLRDALTELREAYAVSDTPRYMRANSHFHLTVIKMARHHAALDILTRLGNLNFNRHFPMAFTTPVGAHANDEHTRIAEAIINRDGDAASAEMHAHLDATIAVLQTQVASDDAFGHQAGGFHGR
jgi:DNA-binding GntR family transcriptional regulator